MTREEKPAMTLNEAWAEQREARKKPRVSSVAINTGGSTQGASTPCRGGPSLSSMTVARAEGLSESSTRLPPAIHFPTGFLKGIREDTRDPWGTPVELPLSVEVRRLMPMRAPEIARRRFPCHRRCRRDDHATAVALGDGRVTIAPTVAPVTALAPPIPVMSNRYVLAWPGSPDRSHELIEVRADRPSPGAASTRRMRTSAATQSRR